MSQFFIRRPIVAIVIAIITVMGGLVAMGALPIAQFPDIIPPQITVTATYNGADALTIEQAVAAPLEQQMNGVDNMLYMQSTNANDGTMQLVVTFDVDTDPNIDQVNVQNRVAQAQANLPPDVNTFGLTMRKATGFPMLVVSLSSPKDTYDALFLANYANINIIDALYRVPGVGQVRVFGASDYAMRIWVKPDRLAKLGLTVPEVVRAVQQQSTVNPSGKIGAQPVPSGQEFSYTVRSQGRLQTAEEFAGIAVRSNPDGSVVRLSDVARIELGALNYGQIGRVNGKPGCALGIFQTPGSNALAVADGVKKTMAELSQRFPPDLQYRYSIDTTLPVSEGIKEILITLAIAIVLVIFVVYLFLQNWRATFIPMIAVPVSLVGTFALFPLLGFSINTLSLFGLVLAIGLVVDDAIVVVEAVEHHIEEGMSPRAAALKAMEEVSAPVVAIALILFAVFVPTTFIPGITGRLYQQFAVTIAVSVVISAFNTLTLSPALSALLLRPRSETGGPLGAFFRWFNRGFSRATAGYLTWSRHLIHKAGFSMGLLLTIGLLGVLLGARLPTGFLPEEDVGYFFMNVQLPVAASLKRTDNVAKRIEEILRETPGVQSFNTVVGFSLLSFVNTTYNAFYFVTLKPWGERNAEGLTAEVIMRRLNQRLVALPEGQAFAFSPPAIPGIGTTGGVTFMLEDRSGQAIEFLTQNVDRFLQAARQRPEFASLTTTFIPAVPQVFVHVDRDKVLKQGVDLQAVYRTLQTFMGGTFVNYFNRFGRVWQVNVQAEGEFRTDAKNAGQFFVRNDKGDMVSLSALMKMETIYGPEFTNRFNGYRAAQINGILAPGYSSGQAMEALQEVFAQTMPREMGYDYSGISFQEKAAAQGVPASVIFGLSLLFVFLILAAQYESWSLPFSVLLSTPVAVFGAFLALWLCGFVNNVYAQIGLVMLIGLSAKNAILIVEFAKLEYERGKSIEDAALAAARLRLRPILMTAFAFILGVVPLAIASGASAAARRIMGTAVMGGMLAASLVAIFFVPVSFYVVERLSQRREAPVPVEASVPPNPA